MYRVKATVKALGLPKADSGTLLLDSDGVADPGTTLTTVSGSDAGSMICIPPGATVEALRRKGPPSNLNFSTRAAIW
jgi:hypothetical protein